jgi:hypothetical protein
MGRNIKTLFNFEPPATEEEIRASSSRTRGSVRAGVLNLSIPGEFEPHKAGIAQWFLEHPPGNAGT